MKGEEGRGRQRRQRRGGGDPTRGEAREKERGGQRDEGTADEEEEVEEEEERAAAQLSSVATRGSGQLISGDAQTDAGCGLTEDEAARSRRRGQDGGAERWEGPARRCDGSAQQSTERERC